MTTRLPCRLLLIASLALTGAAQGNELIDLPDIGDSAGAIISPEQERRLGEDFMRQMRRLAPVVADEEVEDYIQKLGLSMGEFTNYELGFHFFMVESPVINAFAVPGGYIGVHTGLMLETQSESELASVISHGITHVTQRHGARMIEEASQMTIPMIASLVGALVLTAANPEAGAAAMMASQAAAQQHQINFTRANEQEADAIGIRLMQQAGYDTQRMAAFFERMQRASRYTDPAHIPEYLRTHPITVNRIAAARNRAANMQQAVVREDSYAYHLIKAKLRVRAAEDPVQAAHYFHELLQSGDYTHEEVARYGYALALTESGEFERARIELTKLIADYPRVVSFHIAAGQLEQRADRFQESLTHFQRAYELEPENRAAVYGYVGALLLVDRAAEAKRLLGEYGLAERRDPKFYKLLADAETRLGQGANAHHSLAEYYLSVGEFPYAAEQLRIARETPGLSNYQRQKIVARLEEVEDTIQRLEEDRRGR
jgi:predicted Zn-dependent protease